MRRTAVLCATVGAAVVAAVSASGIAWADTIPTYVRNSGAAAEWSPEDQTLRVCDMANDGAGAYATLAVWHEGKGDFVTKLELTDPDAVSGCVSQVFEVEAGTPIQVSVMLVKDGEYTDLKSHEGVA